MHNVELVDVVNPCYDLLEELGGLLFFQSGLANDVVEKLAAASILHYQIKLFWSLNNLIELDNVWVPDELQDVDFSRYSFHIGDISYSIFFQNLNRHLQFLNKNDTFSPVI